MSSQLQLLLEVVFCFTTIIFVAAGSGYAEEAHQQADNVPLPPPPTSFLHTELSELKANYEAIKRQHPHLFPGAASSKTPRHYSNQTTTTGELLEGNKHRRKRFPREGYSDITAREKFFPIAAAAYGDQAEIHKCLKNWLGRADRYDEQPAHDCANQRGQTCFGYTAILRSEKAIVVSFRGTATTDQLLTEGLKTVWENQEELKIGGHAIGKVAWYFYHAFLSVWGNGTGGLSRKVAELHHREPSYKIWVTGHSLGGALASLAALHIYMDILDNKATPDISLFTIGEPRVGDKDFAKKIDDLLKHYTYRVVHRWDIVAGVPKGKNYQHHSTEIWYQNEKMDVEIHDPIKFDAHGDYQHEGQKLHRCPEPDGNSHCFYGIYSSINPVKGGADHVSYFGKEVSTFGEAGCPRPPHKPLSTEECLKSKESLEKQMKDKQAQIDLFKFMYRGARTTEQEIRIERQLTTADFDLQKVWTKYTKLPCVNLCECTCHGASDCTCRPRTYVSGPPHSHRACTIPPTIDPHCEAEKVRLEKRIGNMKKEIADLEKAKKPTKTLRGLLKIYEASYDRLKCVHHLGPTISPRDPDARCKADKAALEKQMKDEQSKIDQLKSSLRGARSSEDLHRIVDPLYTALSDFGILWTKYTKLPCAHLPKPIPPPPDPQCEVTKALLENRIAVIKAEIADLDKKISATRSFVEKENLKTVAKSRRILLKIQQDRYNGLLCVKHPAAPRWLPPAAAKAKPSPRPTPRRPNVREWRSKYTIQTPKLPPSSNKLMTLTTTLQSSNGTSQSDSPTPVLSSRNFRPSTTDSSARSRRRAVDDFERRLAGHKLQAEVYNT